MRIRIVLGGAWLTLALALAAAAAEPLRVMTFNIRYATAPDGDNVWANRKEILLDTIRAFKPDLLGTQEVLALQVDFFHEHLKEYTHVGVGVAFHETPQTGRRLTATLLFGRRPPTNDTVFTPADIVAQVNRARRAQAAHARSVSSRFSWGFPLVTQ